MVLILTKLSFSFLAITSLYELAMKILIEHIDGMVTARLSKIINFITVQWQI